MSYKERKFKARCLIADLCSSQEDLKKQVKHIAKETQLDTDVLIKIGSWLFFNPIGKDWLKEYWAAKGKKTMVEEKGEDQKTMVKDLGTKVGEETPPGKVEEPPPPPPGVERIMEKELWVMAEPIFRKVALNPRIFLFYDYVRTELGYEGDLGDFICDTVEDFFKSRGIKIKIVREKEI